MSKFKIGDKVKRTNGNSRSNGNIVSVFSTNNSECQYCVFQYDLVPGLFSIFTDGDIRYTLINGEEKSLAISDYNSIFDYVFVNK